MKAIKNLLSIFVIIVSFTFVSCENEPVESSVLNQNANETNDENNGLPILTTKPITGVSLTSATSGGNITSDGEYDVYSRGVVWATTQNPTKANSKTINGIGIGNFVSSMTNLKPNTTYYLRAYSTNENGTAYGNQLTFTTTSIFGTYDLTHIMGPTTSSVDINNDGISSINFVDELPQTNFDDDKIVINNDGTFSYVGTDTNQVGNVLYFNDYTLTGNWTIANNILTLTVTNNGPSYVMSEFVISGNTLSERWQNSAAYTYVSGTLTTIYMDYIDYIYTKE